MIIASIKRVLSTALITIFILSNISYLEELNAFNYVRHNYKVLGSPHPSEHTTTYNADPNLAEAVYLEVRRTLGVYYLNNHVTIINVPTKPDGSIGKIGKEEILGLYTSNIILYDGDLITLKHELAHFFYEKMRSTTRSEMYAQIAEKFFVYKQRVSTYKNLKAYQDAQ